MYSFKCVVIADEQGDSNMAAVIAGKRESCSFFNFLVFFGGVKGVEYRAFQFAIYHELTYCYIESFWINCALASG